MTYIKNIACLWLGLALVSCVLQKENTPKIKQGLFGTVTWLEGNRMPSPEMPKSTGPKAIVREIKIYEAVTFEQVQGEAPLFRSVKGKLLKTVKSNAKGFFECELPIGDYSVFTVEEDGKLFANSFDGNGLINGVKVTQDGKVRLDIQVNYKAAF